MSFIASIPSFWIILIILAFIGAIFLIADIVKNAALSANLETGRVKRLVNRTRLFFFLYLVYISILCFSGLLDVNMVPPMIFIYGPIPLFIFFMIIWRSKTFNILLQSIKIEYLISFHSIRFIGSFFFLAYTYNLLPRKFAFMAGGGDVITAIFAIILVLFIAKLGRWKNGTIIAFNIFGLIDILNVIITANLLTLAAIENGGDGVLRLVDFPFVFIPAMAPATIVFCHLLIFKKVKLSRSEAKE